MGGWVRIERPGAFRLTLSCFGLGPVEELGELECDEEVPSASDRDSDEELPMLPSASTNMEGVSEGTGTRCEDCFRLREDELAGGVGGTRSIEIEGTGGGDCTLSLPLKSLMKPLFFRPMVL